MSKRVKLDFSKFYKNPHYPSESVSLKSAVKFKNNTTNLPLEQLLEKYETIDHKSLQNEEFVVHWFRKDLRIHDNTSFYHSVVESLKSSSKVIGLYVISTQFWINHFDSAWKINLIERRLDELRSMLKDFNIPLVVVYFDDAGDASLDFSSWCSKLIKERLHSSTVYFNIIYDYDEIKRDISLLAETELDFRIYHDECIIPPLKLTTGSGSQFKKFSPWFKKWVQYLQDDPIVPKLLSVKDHKFPDWDSSSLNSDQYTLPSPLQLSFLETYGATSQDFKAFKDYYKVTDDHISKELNKFIESRARSYANEKSIPSLGSTSRLSAYITTGAISTRHIIHIVQEYYHLKRLDGGHPGVQDYIKEVSWRDFYKHVIVAFPFLGFDLPYNFNTLDIEWTNNEENFAKWCLGKTGYPIIDAAMRELLHTGYMNNRNRMLCSSFLAKDMMIDWRWGMNWFHNHLVDGDYSSNHGGWSWASSSGVDCQPWFRMFNVLRQSGIQDPEGKFIKKWCPELKDVPAKSLHTAENVENYVDNPVAIEPKDDRLDKFREVMQKHEH